MAKGFFTQGLVVLFERAPSLDALASLYLPLLANRKEDGAGWLSGPSLVLRYRPEVNGFIAVDVVDRPWPDDMGHPQKAPELFAAWSMGHFGPFAFPGSLERACQQSWQLSGRPDEQVARHRAFVRLRLSYGFGARPEDPVFPEGIDPVHELRTLHVLASKLFGVSGSLYLFNPNAEVLLDGEKLAQLEDDAAEDERIPIDAWSNVRLYRLEGLADGWSMMDTVGLRQLDRTELEACFPEDLEPGAVADMLRSASLYVVDEGDVIEDGHTLDGPEGTAWRARHRSEGTMKAPPRPVVQLVPEGVTLPAKLR